MAGIVSQKAKYIFVFCEVITARIIAFLIFVFCFL